MLLFEAGQGKVLGVPLKDSSVKTQPPFDPDCWRSWKVRQTAEERKREALRECKKGASGRETLTGRMKRSTEEERRVSEV
jgi:hypothetical protein